MTTVNYPSPISVNGYSCRNCSDVDNAKRNIDPAHPKDGPFGVNRLPKPGVTGDTPAVTFGGQLLHATDVGAVRRDSPAARGLHFDLKV